MRKVDKREAAEKHYVISAPLLLTRRSLAAINEQRRGDVLREGGGKKTRLYKDLHPELQPTFHRRRALIRE